MSRTLGRRAVKHWLALGVMAMLSCSMALADDAPVPDLPDAFGVPMHQWAATMDGHPWGSTAAIEIGPGGTVWAIDRCGAGRCEGSDIAPIDRLDLSAGRAVAAIGAGLFVFPHGLTVDRQGDLWVTDAAASKDGTKGEQVVKLSPDGKVLMRLGTAGQAGGGPDHFNDPSDVIVAKNGDIFVSDGHNGQRPDTPPGYVTRIIKFSPTGRFIKAWGRLGSGPSEFRNPHALAFDSRGRLFVADRGNSRIQIFDQDGRFLAQWKQFGRPSGLYIDAHDTLYAIDADSSPANHPGWPHGIWIGSARTGKVTGFVPDAEAGEGVLLGPDGNLYGAVNVAPHGITKYPKLLRSEARDAR